MTDNPVVSFEGTDYPTRPGETVLQCLERNGVAVQSFCRAGVCQSCVMKAVDGRPSAKAQTGLRDSWKRQGLFLSCMCETTQSLCVARSNVVGSHETEVVASDRLSPTVQRVLLSKPSGFEFQAGQFVQLQRKSDGLSRPYSIASLPTDEHLEFHVQVLPDGKLSPWFADAVGETVVVQGPLGECSYVPDEPDRVIVLAGSGTGLAPLLGIVRAAALAQHRGNIHLYHGGKSAADLYYWAELVQLADEFDALRVTGVCLDGDKPLFVTSRVDLVPGDLVATVLARHSTPAEQRSYLCGNPALVHSLKKKLFLAGASLARIHSDPFLPPADNTNAA